MDPQVWQQRVGRLRKHRNRPDRDLTLTSLKASFKRDVARPYKQLAGLADLWAKHIPEPLLSQTRLDGLSRGILRVTAGNAAAMYELDRLLRAGLERQLIAAQPASLRKVRLTLGVVEDDPSA